MLNKFFSSNTGIINIYNAATAFQNPDPAADSTNLFTPKPLYSINNLTTKVKFCNFSRDAQLMAFGSTVKVIKKKFFFNKTLYFRFRGAFKGFKNN